MISAEMLIEDLVAQHPRSVRYLMQKGIRCIVCGDPIWGTLGSAAREKGFTDEEIAIIVDELNELSRSEM